jgi:hypothetical protein
MKLFLSADFRDLCFFVFASALTLDVAHILYPIIRMNIRGLYHAQFPCIYNDTISCALLHGSLRSLFEDPRNIKDINKFCSLNEIYDFLQSEHLILLEDSTPSSPDYELYYPTDYEVLGLNFPWLSHTIQPRIKYTTRW